MTHVMESEAVEAVRVAAGSVGLVVKSAEPDRGADLVLENPAGGQVFIQLKQMSLASIDGVGRRIHETNIQQAPGSTVWLVVADRVTSDARELLSAAGWGWLDLRGHLHVVGSGMFVDADIPAMRRARRTPPTLSGQVGVEVAAALLLKPDEPAAVRRIAAALKRAPSSVSDVLAKLRAANLITGDRKPVVPELFNLLADNWRTTSVDLKALPPSDDAAITSALKLGLRDIEKSTGWALTDTLAAAAYGAPVGARVDHPPDFYVANELILKRAVQLLGTPEDRQDRAATLRVAPISTICADRIDATTWTNTNWPLAQPLFVALDLAQDPGRGRLVLHEWTPPRERGARVW